MALTKINYLNSAEASYAAYKAGVCFGAIGVDGTMHRQKEKNMRHMMQIAPLNWIGLFHKPYPLDGLWAIVRRLCLKGVQLPATFLNHRSLISFKESSTQLWIYLPLKSRYHLAPIIYYGQFADVIELHITPVLDDLTHIAEFLNHLPTHLLERIFISGVRSREGIAALCEAGITGISFSALDLLRKDGLDVQRIAFAIRTLGKAQNARRDFEEQIEQKEDFSVETEWSKILNYI